MHHEGLCHGPCREQELAPPSEGAPELSVESLKGSLARTAEAWQVYRGQAVFPAALALALLYLTVMNFVSLLCPPQLSSTGFADSSRSKASLHKLSGRILCHKCSAINRVWKTNC